ncbi:hypothetical protein CRP118_gp1 [Roseobacter phage CRP-118]|uniref:Uncharacterized protein n=1 Tax=Roseobacter phage CRP-118 TaxID=3072843 RepID=A0AAX4G2G4_9CAUD|nr:hypothetical protein CRP118_gp1 [Roseobacter phage CRP-118]
MTDTPTHNFKCTLGIPRQGTIQGRYEGQGTDVSVFMRDTEGKLFVLSGSSLKTLERIKHANL